MKIVEKVCKTTGRKIARIDYDLRNNPVRIQFTNGSVTKYVYSAAGEKLRVTHYTAVPNISVAIGSTRELAFYEIQYRDSTDYLCCGSLTLKNGRIDKYLFDEGYCQAEKYVYNASKDNFTFCYYDRDHLGNIRKVREADSSKGGYVIQTMDYYPFGAQFCHSGTDNNVQPYRYNGKEFDKMHGLNTYDYGARQYNPITARWDRVDPLCENYYNISPYAYCANSPVMYIDPTGMDYWSTNDPNVISEFLNNLKTFGFSNLDYKEWNHTTDADFLANLSYNDQTNKYYYSHGTVENGEVVCYSKAFDPDISSDWSIPFDVANSVYNQADNIRWGSNGQFYYRNPQGYIFHGSQYVSVKSINTPGLRFLAKCNYPVQFAIGGYNTIQGVIADGGWGYNATYQSSTALGGIAGGWAVGKAGMWLGGIIGGVPGAIIVGVLGGVLGSWGASSLAEYGMDKYYQK